LRDPADLAAPLDARTTVGTAKVIAVRPDYDRSDSLI
jgi:hypothetical protein